MSERLARSPDRFVRELDEELGRRTKRDGEGAFKKAKLRSVIAECGWKAQSKNRVEQLQTALEIAGVFPFPDLDDPDLDRDDWVRFSKSPGVDRPLGKIFGSEAGIQRFIYRYHTEVFADSASLSELELIGREVPLLSGRDKREADLVFKDPDGRYVIVEFKRADPELGAPNQLREYMDALRESGKPLGKGVLITAKPRSEKLERLIREDIAARSSDYPIDWYWYSVEVHLETALDPESRAAESPPR